MYVLLVRSAALFSQPDEGSYSFLPSEWFGARDIAFPMGRVVERRGDWTHIAIRREGRVPGGPHELYGWVRQEDLRLQLGEPLTVMINDVQLEIAAGIPVERVGEQLVLELPQYQASFYRWPYRSWRLPIPQPESVVLTDSLRRAIGHPVHPWLGQEFDSSTHIHQRRQLYRGAVDIDLGKASSSSGVGQTVVLYEDGCALFAGWSMRPPPSWLASIVPWESHSVSVVGVRRFGKPVHAILPSGAFFYLDGSFAGYGDGAIAFTRPIAVDDLLCTMVDGVQLCQPATDVRLHPWLPYMGIHAPIPIRPDGDFHSVDFDPAVFQAHLSLHRMDCADVPAGLARLRMHRPLGARACYGELHEGAGYGSDERIGLNRPPLLPVDLSSQWDLSDLWLLHHCGHEALVRDLLSWWLGAPITGSVTDALVAAQEGCPGE